MTQIQKTETELAEEVVFLRRRVAELESREARAGGTGRESASGCDQLHAILRAFDGYIYVCSRDFRIEYMNAPLIRRTGYDAAGDLCYKALHDRDDVCPWCVNDRVFNGETVRWHVRSPKDGRWYDVINTPYYNGDGGVCKQSMMIDVTDRMQARNALQETREKYHELVENANCIIPKLDADGRIAFMSDYGQGVFGYSADDIFGAQYKACNLAPSGFQEFSLFSNGPSLT